MAMIDYIVMALYLAGILAVGFVLSKKVKSSGDLFAAGGRSPWWASGLSAFMTMFSAGTFVVWGGIAYERGLAAVSINLCYGVAALAAGYLLAGRWKNLGIDSPAEYVTLRFGKPALHLYTWTMLVYRMVGVAVALYALAKIMVALMPLGVVLYTMVGGLWAVLMTDVLQFIVLTLAVLFVSTLILLKAGDAGASIQQIPENFLSPTSGEYGMLFLAGWTAIHFFMIGAEWAFVQRYLCVEDEPWSSASLSRVSTRNRRISSLASLCCLLAWWASWAPPCSPPQRARSAAS
jgi:Na+/proline symporter